MSTLLENNSLMATPIGAPGEFVRFGFGVP